MVKVNLKHLKGKKSGLYVYVSEKGHKPRYYKWGKGDIIDAYKEYYLDTVVDENKRGTLKEYKKAFGFAHKGEKYTGKAKNRAEEYMKRLKKQKTINRSIKKGISYSKVKDAIGSGNVEVVKAKRMLLKKLVADRQLLELLITPQNMEKFKERLEYRIQFKDNNNNTLAITTTFNKVPERVITELRNSVVKGEEINRTKTPTLSKKLDNLGGYTGLNILKNGFLSKVSMDIVFRKG